MIKMFNKKYIAVFLLKDQESYEIEAKKKFKPTEKSISFRKKSYPVNIKEKSYSKGLFVYYCFDIDTKKQLNLNRPKEVFLGSKAMDLAIAEKIIPDLTKDMSDTSFKKNIYNLIIGIIIGGLTSFIIAGFIFGGFNINV